MRPISYPTTLPANAAAVRATRAKARLSSALPGTIEIFSPAMNRPMATRRVSPGRNGKKSPHSTKMIARLIQKNAVPNWSSSQFGSIHWMPKRSGINRVVGLTA